MSAILKVGSYSQNTTGTNAFHMNDLLAEAHALIASAKQQSETILNQARRQATALAHRARQQGYEAGFEQGMTAGTAQGEQKAYEQAQANYQRELKQLTQSCTSLLREVDSQRQRCLHEAQRDVLSFAVDLARRVTHIEAQTHPEVVQHNLSEALQLVMHQSDVQVHVHPTDLATLRKFAADQANDWANMPHLHFVEDESIRPGGVKLKTDHALIDATLQTQLDQIATGLLGSFRES